MEKIDRKMKQLHIIAAAILAAVFLFGCAAVINEEITEVSATVVDIQIQEAKHYKVPFVEPTTYLTKNAVFTLIIEYDGIQTQVESTALYLEYKNRIGDTIPCELVTTTYDSGEVIRTLRLGSGK